MTVLGAMVFGGILALGVLWLLVTAPDSDVKQQWIEMTEPDQLVSAASGRSAH